MKKTVWVCGLIAGVISSVWFVYSMMLPPEEHQWEMGMLYGYATMLLAFSLIFVGIRNFRDKYNGGAISLGKAFLIGLYITLIASTMYVGIWLIDFKLFHPDFMAQYQTHIEKVDRANGVSEAEIQKKAAEMAGFTEMYNNNILFAAAISYVEILPVGLLVSLIAALILKKKRRSDTAPATAGT